MPGRSVVWRHKERLCSRLCGCLLIWVYCGIFLSSNQNTVDRFPSYKRYESVVETEAQDEDVKREKEKLMHITSSSSECSSFSVFVKVRAALYVNSLTGLSSLNSRCPRTCYSLLCLCCCCCCFFSSVCFYLFFCLLFNLKLFATKCRETFVKEPKRTYSSRSNHTQTPSLSWVPGSFSFLVIFSEASRE